MRRWVTALSLATAGIFISVFGALQFASAAGATLYLTPASASVQQQNTIKIAIHVNTGGEAVSGVQADLSYPTDKFDVSAANVASSSDFPTTIETTVGSGSIHIVRGAALGSGGISGSNLLVVDITFTAKNTAGVAAINFVSSSQVIRASDSTNILSGTTGGSYTVTAPPASPSSPPSSGGSSSPGSSSSSSSSSSKKTSGSSPSSTPTPAPTPAVAGDKIAPKISDVKVVDISFKAATITWTTSEPATSIVEYGVTANHGLSAIDGSFVTNHKVVLPTDGLASGYQFSFMVKSVDPAGNMVTSNNATFTTKGLTLQVNVIDQKSKGVKGAKVSLGSRTAVSDKQGIAKLTELPAGKHELKVQFGGKTKSASVSILDNENAKPQTTTVKIVTSELPLYVKIPIVLGIIVLLAVVGVFALRFIRSRGGGGDIGPLASGPTEPSSAAPVNNVDSLPPATVVRPTEVGNPNQPQQPQ
ncbi:hypothetical protein COU91_00635 [Candidatus Saccharibacteria bacterium CG10_big_fil_rev_8_21_14_0_10_47_8]|nr:MAG: hypothetical protein COU91_00635 [Candidatus Saccharibacteria bacterium CG10_big_fil_rev_8_21_14_0_10_47_8]